MAYDIAEWHYGGNFPDDLAPENGGTHIGIFLAWAIHRSLAGDVLLSEADAQVEAVRERQMTGREFLFEVCDQKFWEDDLNAEGNDFAKAYYATDLYLSDYSKSIGADLPSLYHAKDTWQNFDRVSEEIDQRFARWKKNKGRPWWQFWRARI